MIGIVTVLYNSASVLADFFKSLNIQTYKHFILFVVDNNSNDNSLAEAERLAKKVNFQCVILPQNNNWGVAKGNNIGIEAALKEKCDYILLSNNDIVLERDTIQSLFSGLIKHNASMAVPKIYFYNSDKIIWSAGGNFWLARGVTRQFGYNKKDEGQFDEDSVVDYSPTCFMIIHKSVFSKIGFMDEKFFVYYDDTDFVYRAVILNQLRLVYISNSLLWHKESSSTGGNLSDFTIKYLSRNKVYFARKHYSFFMKICLACFILIHYILVDIFVLSPKQRQILRCGLISGLRV